MVQASPDAPAQYVPTMNAIFAAQKAQILIDACDLLAGASPSSIASSSNTTIGAHPPTGPAVGASAAAPTSPSLYLQQAAHITRGVYFAPASDANLFQVCVRSDQCYTIVRYQYICLLSQVDSDKHLGRESAIFCLFFFLCACGLFSKHLIILLTPSILPTASHHASTLRCCFCPTRRRARC